MTLFKKSKHKFPNEVRRLSSLTYEQSIHGPISTTCYNIIKKTMPVYQYTE